MKAPFAQTSILLALLLSAWSCHAADDRCSARITGTLNSYFKQKAESLAICHARAMPADPRRTIAVSAYVDPQSETDRYRSFSGHVTVLDPSGVLASYDNDYEEDAGFGLGDLSIDTAAYVLRPGTRAFGIRLFNSPPVHCNDGADNNTLSLYIQEQGKLRSVLSIDTEYWENIQGQCGSARTIINKYAKLYLSMGKSSTRSFHDIVVTAVAHYEITGEDGKTTLVKVKPYVETLKYNGKDYGSLSSEFESWFHADQLHSQATPAGVR